MGAHVWQLAAALPQVIGPPEVGSAVPLTLPPCQAVIPAHPRPSGLPLPTPRHHSSPLNCELAKAGPCLSARDFPCRPKAQALVKTGIFL